MSGPEVSYHCRGPLAVIRLERPEALNALTYSMIAEVKRLALVAQADPQVIALCITGAGRGFCAGLDMTVLAQTAGSSAPRALPSADVTPQRTALFSFLIGAAIQCVGHRMTS